MFFFFLHHPPKFTHSAVILELTNLLLCCQSPLFKRLCDFCGSGRWLPKCLRGFFGGGGSVCRGGKEKVML